MLKIPNNCPSCNGGLTRVNNQLFCTNINCSSKNLEQIKKYTKTMRIMGLGEQTILKLGLECIDDIYYLDEGYVRDVLGDKIAEKLLREIEKSQTITLSTFLTSMSIPHIGKTTAEKVEALNMELVDIMVEDLHKAGIGKVASDSLLNWIDNEWLDGYDILPISFLNPATNNNFSMVICISGKTPGYTKSQIAEILAENGVQTVNTVNSKIQYLISESTTTAKAVKAKELNVPIVGFKRFLEENINNESKVE